MLLYTSDLECGISWLVNIKRNWVCGLASASGNYVHKLPLGGVK